MNEPFLLSNLIELQEIDNKIYKLEVDKKGSESVEKLMALESEFNEVNKKIESQKTIMGSYFKDIEEISKTSNSILQKISSINIKLEDKSLDANELLNYTKQKESSQSQVSQLEKKKNIHDRNNEDEIKEMQLLNESLNDYKLENNQCGCCGVDLTTSELDAISATEFQQCPYCDGVLV
jgi:predicted  nucleic acid-binding Zn-ribbon protein